VSGFRPAFNELDLVAAVLDVGQAREIIFQIITLADQSLFGVKILV
jgi:hypothetical protein